MDLLFEESKVLSKIRDDYKPCLVDLLDDLFCNLLVILNENEKTCPLIKNKSQDNEHKKSDILIRCIPNEWIGYDKIPDEKKKSFVTSFSAFVNGEKSNYSIGNSITERFFINPQKTKATLYRHLEEIMHDSDVIVEKKLLKKYMKNIIWLSKKNVDNNEIECSGHNIKINFPTKMKHFVGEDKQINRCVIERQEYLLNNDKIIELIAGFMLSFIVITKFMPDKGKTVPPINNNLCALLIWYNLDELAKFSFLNKNLFKECKQKDILYLYAVSFFYNNKSDLSYEIIKDIKIDKNGRVPTNTKMLNLLCAKHKLLGRGCNKNVLSALDILRDLSKCKTEVLDENKKESPWQQAVKNERNIINKDIEQEIVSTLNKVLSGYYGDVEVTDSYKKNRSFEKKYALKNKNNYLEYLPQNTNVNRVEHFNFSKGDFDLPCCVLNGKSKEASAFINGLYNYKIISLCDEENLGSAVLTANSKKICFLLFSEDEDKNINDCLCLINRLFEVEILDSISDNIDIYVKANFEYASMLIDSTLNIKEGLLRVHICDYNKLVAQKLLSDAPLYIPRLTGDTKSNIVVFGTNEATFQLVKEAVAVAFDHSIRISVLGNEAKIYKNKLIQQAPGIYKESEHLNRITPIFYDCDLASVDFIDLLTVQYKEANLNKIKEVLQTGTYFVVDLGNDKDNLLFSTKLRGWLLSCDKMFTRAPFIAVKCESGQNTGIAKNFVVNNKTAGSSYYNNYNLYFYGIKEDVFSSKYLDIKKNPKKLVALNIHLSYLDKNSTDAEIESAIKTYFKFSYNRDSSECASISLTYMFYYLGLIEKLEDLKLDNESLSKKYKKWIKNESHLKTAARYEHSRWVGYMLSRGWQSATLEQVEAYAGQESSGHKHLLCKLHPFICNWDDFFDDTEEGVKINALKNGIKNLKLPIDSTNNIVSSIVQILTNNPFAHKESELAKSR